MTGTTPITPKRCARDRTAEATVLPADASLVALCAEFGSNERVRRRLIASLLCQRGNRDALQSSDLKI